ncbi:hypothetical protein Cni_G22898 [Canna indica]|uniref:SUZ domain-containing protein n=1 Tax=Canna indica TaxID=4628 RepID=A0AAQ3KSF1_9LILI|nr:hypothetical protein Cni_G22898 [Canna indica]
MMEGLRAQMDSFLVEALENPCHHLTILRMEFDIQRCAAHRVAQHYGLQTMALDNSAGGLGSKVITRKMPDSKFPAICLSQVPTVKQIEKEMSKQLKIVIHPRSIKSSPIDDAQLGLGKDTVRFVEERMEEYDRARARIFTGPSGSEMDVSPSTDSDMRSMSSSRDEQDYTLDELEKALNKDNASRVAIFRDREKDLSDPDYDRSYHKYVRGLTSCQNFGLQTCNIPQPPFL